MNRIEQINEIYVNAMKRAKAVVDVALDPVLSDGVPPFGEKLTVRMLRQMHPDQAEALLRMELRRTMLVDELTGEQIPDKETLALIMAYMGGNDSRPSVDQGYGAA